MNMIEKMARAMQAADRVRAATWEDESDGNRWAYLQMARAALTALREPTDAMTSADENVHWGYSCHVCGGLKEGWYALIDAALKE